MGKKNFEVRPLAVNKSDIVKRILYFNPDTEFIFCAGDDKTGEDMFRALLLSPQSQPRQPQAQRDERVCLAPPLSVMLFAKSASASNSSTSPSSAAQSSRPPR